MLYILKNKEYKFNVHSNGDISKVTVFQANHQAINVSTDITPIRPSSHERGKYGILKTNLQFSLSGFVVFTIQTNLA